MKQLSTLLLCFLTTLILCACAGPKGVVIEADESTFLVNLTIESDTEIYTIHYEYYLADVATGGGLIGYTDETALAQGEVLTKDFTTQDFPEGADISDFQLEIIAMDKDGNEYPCDSLISFEAQYGSTYEISISGDFATGFQAELAD